MISLFFVGDGPRDEAMVPPLVKTILQATFDHVFRAWPRLNVTERGRGRRLGGYGRKLLFALRQARDALADGLVAVVDDDNTGGVRLRQLRRARAIDRQDWPGFPAALGQAKPHAEAWLLDDPGAVREGLGLPEDAEVPSVDASDYPKRALHELWERSPRKRAHPDEREIDALAGIARKLAVTRCHRARQTGFRSFVTEVRRELGGLAGD